MHSQVDVHECSVANTWQRLVWLKVISLTTILYYHISLIACIYILSDNLRFVHDDLKKLYLDKQCTAHLMSLFFYGNVYGVLIICHTINCRICLTGYFILHKKRLALGQTHTHILVDIQTKAILRNQIRSGCLVLNKKLYRNDLPPLLGL